MCWIFRDIESSKIFTTASNIMQLDASSQDIGNLGKLEKIDVEKDDNEIISLIEEFQEEFQEESNEIPLVTVCNKDGCDIPINNMDSCKKIRKLRRRHTVSNISITDISLTPNLSGSGPQDIIFDDPSQRVIVPCKRRKCKKRKRYKKPKNPFAK